jgi:hypothetical protein
MNRKSICALLGIAVSGAALVSADVPSAWRSWKYTRGIEQGETAGLSYVALDRGVTVHSENQLADLRLIDDAGQEVPYEVRSRITAATEPVHKATSIRENSFAQGQFTQVIADLGVKPEFHNTLQVETAEQDFINWVEVAASDDGRLWRIVKARAPISRFRKNKLEGTQTIPYSENNARFLRLRIQEPGRQFSVTGIEVYFMRAPEADLVPESEIALTQHVAPDAGGDRAETQWTIDVGSDAIPVSRVSFETSQPDFYRGVRIQRSKDGKQWEPGGGGQIYRHTEAGKTEESLGVTWFETWGPRYWRVAVMNGNDAPLSEARLTLAMSQRYVIFHARQSRSYRLIYGNYRANAPQYDLAKTLRIRSNEKLARLRLRDEDETSNYADPRPFTERHPNLLWVALGLAVVLLGAAAVYSLRSPGRGEEAS